MDILNPYGINPIYNTVPAIDGVEGIVASLAGLLSPLLGRRPLPYTDPGQAVANAVYAANALQQQQRAFGDAARSQFGEQIGSTVANVLTNIDPNTGMTPAQAREDLRRKYAGFAVGTAGSFMAPLADSALSSIGLTGGSILGASNIAFQQRMMLGMPGGFSNPYDYAAQSAITGRAAAFSRIVNDMISLDGGIRPDYAVTHGLSRETVYRLGLRMAGSGAMDVNGVSIGRQLSDAVSGSGLDLLELGTEDINGTGGRLGPEQAVKLRAARDRIRKSVQAATDTLGALRDLLGDIGDDKLMAELDKLTNGSWAGSVVDANRVAGQIREVTAVATMYNLDPTAAVKALSMNRDVLQRAAGFTPDMIALGFNGGGMFGIGAQAALFESSEALINALGLRGDPVGSRRVRMQGLQSMARAINTRGGVSAQVLEYGRQTGVFSDDEYESIRRDLMSGEDSVRKAAMERIQIAMFGSVERGQTMMQDSTFINNLRQNMDDDAGRAAILTMMTGVSNEWNHRERMTLLRGQFNAAGGLLAASGMSAKLMDGDVSKVLDGIDSVDPTGELGRTFRAQYARRVKAGESPESALDSTISALQKSEKFKRFGDRLDMSVKSTLGEIFLQKLDASGEDGFIASGLLRTLRQNGIEIGADDATAVSEAIKGGKGADALSILDRILAGKNIDPDTRRQLEDERKRLRTSYAAQRDDIATMRETANRLGIVQQNGSGGTTAVNVQNRLIANLRKLSAGAITREEYNDEIARLDVSGILGADAAAQYMAMGDKAMSDAEADRASVSAFLRREGKISLALLRNTDATLDGSGFGLSMAGWNDGRARTMFGTAASEKAKRQIMDRLAAGDAQFGKTRQNLAQRLLAFAEGEGDIGTVLGMYDEEQLRELFGSDYDEFLSSSGAVSAAQKKFSAASDRLRKRREELAKGRKFKESNALRSVEERIRNGESYDDIIKDAGYAISPEDEAILREMEKTRAGGDKSRGTAEKLVEKAIAGDPNKAALLEYKASLTKSAYAVTDKIRARIAGLDLDGDDEAWGNLGKLVGDDALRKHFAAKFGEENVESLMKDQRARRDAMREIAVGMDDFSRIGGKTIDGDALAAFKRIKADSEERTMRIKGTLELDMGGTSVAARLTNAVMSASLT